MTPEPGLAQRLGGRWAISAQGYLLDIGAVLLMVLLSEPSAVGSPAGLGKWLLLCVLGFAAMGAYLLVLVRLPPWRTRRERPVPLWLVVLQVATSCVVLGLFLALGPPALGLDASTPPVEWLIGFTLLGTWTGLIIVLILDQADRGRQARAALVERQVSVELAALQQDVLVDQMRREMEAGVAAGLGGARRDLQARAEALQGTPGAGAQVPGLLRSIAEDTVRPMSAELWPAAAREYPRVSWWGVLANTFRHEPLRPGLLILFHLLGAGLPTINRFGTVTGVAMLAFTCAVILVVSLPANSLMRRYPAHHLPIFIVAACLLESYNFGMAAWREAVVPGSGSTAWIATQVLAGFVVITLTSSFGSWRTVRRSLDRAYEARLADDEARAIARARAVADLAREVSTVLHGAVQGRLVACAIRSEQAVASGDPAQLASVLADAQHVLADGLRSRPVGDGIAAEVRRKLALWDGFCAVTLLLDPAVEGGQVTDAEGGTVVARVVEEALTNAVRHGGATNATVQVMPSGDQVRTVVDDDGRGPASTSTPGMGSAFLDRATGGRWALTAGAEGAHLEAFVPAGAPRS